MKSLLPFLVIFSTFGANLPAAQTPGSSAAVQDYSGMYSFLKDGEFIQVTIEDKGAVSGFISRYGDTATDKGTFLDQFIKSGKSDGNKLSFTTDSVHGVSFNFEGTFERGPGKSLQDESYFVIRGTLTRISSDAEKKTTSQSRRVEFKSFPRDAEPGPH